MNTIHKILLASLLALAPAHNASASATAQSKMSTAVAVTVLASVVILLGGTTYATAQEITEKLGDEYVGNRRGMERNRDRREMNREYS